jgi:hypothetical protein
MYPFVVNGGTIFGVGGGNLTTPSSDSKANSVIWYGSFSKDKTITVKDSDGKKVLSYKPAGNGEVAIFSSPALVVGETYTVTDGTSEATFTIEDNVTTVGTNTGFGGPGGFGGRGEQNGFGRPDGNNMGGKRDFGGNPPENFDKNKDFNKKR